MANFVQYIPEVRSVGPIPRIPSTPLKPSDVLATPMLCLVMDNAESKETVSVNSVPIGFIVCQTEAPE